MTTSSVFTFDPTVAGLLDEAAERAGMDPSSLTQRHINSAKMSLNLMFSEWAVKDGDSLYRVANSTATVLTGVNYFTPATGCIDLVDLVQSYNSEDGDMRIVRRSRQDYLNIIDKDDTGRPQLYYVDQSVLNTPKVYLWPVPDATVVFTYDYIRYVQAISSLGETLDVHRPWLEAAASGLAYRLAVKYDPARVGLLKPLADEAYRYARRAGSGNSSVTISVRGFGSSRTLRRA